jgi:hypothetical protein
VAYDEGMSDERRHVHELVDQLPPGKLGAIAGLLKAMIEDGEELSEEDLRAIEASREYFRKGGEGLTLDQVAASLGFTMDQIRGRDHG